MGVEIDSSFFLPNDLTVKYICVISCRMSSLRSVKCGRLGVVGRSAACWLPGILAAADRAEPSRAEFLFHGRS